MTLPRIDPPRSVNPALSHERNCEAGLAGHESSPLMGKAAILQSFRLRMRVSPISGRLIRPAESGNYGRMNDGFSRYFSLRHKILGHDLLPATAMSEMPATSSRFPDTAHARERRPARCHSPVNIPHALAVSTIAAMKIGQPSTRPSEPMPRAPTP